MSSEATHKPGRGPVTDLPGYGPVHERQLSGYLPVTGDGGAYIYFWYVETAEDADNAPIVLWLNGGPGSTSFLGFFAENGPYKVESGGASLKSNPCGWNRRAGYLMIDQPAGTGLSLVLDKDQYAKTEEQASDQMYRGLQAFFAAYPELRKRDLYLFGESYAGVYVPLLATRILDGNAATEPNIALKGIGVGDGWVDPLVQQSTYGDYAYAHGLIGLPEKTEVDRLYAACAKCICESQPLSSRKADKVCNLIEEYITKVSGGANVYDVRITGDYDFDDIGTYLDRQDVRRALHIDPRVGPWAETSKRVAFLLERGEQNSFAHLYPRLFDTLRVLIYNGIYDMDCNFMGTDAWIGRLHWSYREELLSAPRTPWMLGADWAGHIRRAKLLTQVLVQGAGHLVPMDQPQRALSLFTEFVRGRI